MTPLAVLFLVIHASTYSIRMKGTSLTFYAISNKPAFEVIHSGISYHYGLDQLSGYAATNVKRNRLSNYVRETQFIHINHTTIKLTRYRIGTKSYPITPGQLPMKINIQ